MYKFILERLFYDLLSVSQDKQESDLTSLYSINKILGPFKVMFLLVGCLQIFINKTF